MNLHDATIPADWPTDDSRVTVELCFRCVQVRPCRAVMVPPMPEPGVQRFEQPVCLTCYLPKRATGLTYRWTFANFMPLNPAEILQGKKPKGKK